MERRQPPARMSERAPKKHQMDVAAAIHLAALAACFAAHLAFAGEFDGVRRALQTIAAASGQTIVMSEAGAAADSTL